MSTNASPGPQAAAAANAAPTGEPMGEEHTRRLTRKVRFGHIHADDVTFAGALDAIVAGARAGHGGYVVTPNVDHVCLAEENPELVAAYRHALLSLVDGVPLLWLARLMRTPLPEKISGSDLMRPLIARAASEGLRVFFLGGVPGVADKAAAILRAEYPTLQVAGTLAPPLGFEKDPAQNDAVLKTLREAKSDVVLVALGCPKQELWMYRNRAALAPAVALGIGASLDFIAGVVRRAPPWMSKVGLEWLYRLAQEPKRMAQRYLVRDRAIVGVALRMWRMPRQKRAFFAVPQVGDQDQ